MPTYGFDCVVGGHAGVHIAISYERRDVVRRCDVCGQALERQPVSLLPEFGDPRAPEDSHTPYYPPVRRYPRPVEPRRRRQSKNVMTGNWTSTRAEGFTGPMMILNDVEMDLSDLTITTDEGPLIEGHGATMTFENGNGFEHNVIDEESK